MDLHACDLERGGPATYTYGTPPFEKYWGDFFAFRFLPATATGSDTDLAVFSSDELRGCLSSGNTWQGDNLHVAAFGWPGTVPSPQ